MLKLQYINTRGNILREDLTSVKSNPKQLKPHHQDMARLCVENHGVGLSASQVGLRENFFFVAASAKFPTKKGGSVPHLCVNPSWEPSEKSQKAVGEEGCLSLPGRKFDVERETVIEAEWDNVVGHRVKNTLKGFAARVFQHEYDHLKGITLLASGKERN